MVVLPGRASPGGGGWKEGSTSSKVLRRAGSANFECCIGEGISRPEGAGVGRAIGLGTWSEDEHVLTGDFLGESAIIAQLCRSEDQVGERSRRLVTKS